MNNSTILWSVIVSIVTGLKKELKNAISKDETGIISEWQSAIINHLYWVAASTPENVDWKDIVLSKWKSLCSHIVNVHKHPNQPYRKCEHSRRKRGEKKKKYMKRSEYWSSVAKKNSQEHLS